MDIETEIKRLKDRVTALENARDIMTEQFKQALTELEDQPLIGSLVRMFRNRVIKD